MFIDFILAILSAIYFSIWRRGFGGAWNDKPFIENRFLQHILGGIAVFSLVFIRFSSDSNNNYILIFKSLYTAIIVQGLFWALAHGFGFDCGRDGYPDEKMLKRYEKVFYNKFFLTPIYNFFKWKKYGYTYDLLSMFLRYTLPCVLLIPVFGFEILIMGAIVSPIYAFCWSFRELENERYGSTALAEYIVGATTGLCLALL